MHLNEATCASICHLNGFKICGFISDDGVFSVMVSEVKDQTFIWLMLHWIISSCSENHPTN